MEIWKRAADDPPPEGVPVRTLTAAGLEQTLVRVGPLWYFPDRTMYVYYSPDLWRPLTDGERQALR